MSVPMSQFMKNVSKHLCIELYALQFQPCCVSLLHAHVNRKVNASFQRRPGTVAPIVLTYKIKKNVIDAFAQIKTRGMNFIFKWIDQPLPVTS